MKLKGSTIGLFGGVLLCLVLWNLPLADLPPDGQKCLALSLMVIVWWATKALPTGFASLALLLGYTLLLNPEIAPTSVVFGLWTNPIIYLVIGGFLLAEAVQISGLGKRLALGFVGKFIRSYKGVIISCYLLGFILSFMIPHPWPRSFLILSVMGYVIKAANLEEKWAVNIGLAIFAGSVPNSMILLTGDSTLNPVVAGFAGESLSYMQWIQYMSLPGIVATVLTCLIQLKLCGGPKEFHLNREYISAQLEESGSISKKEISCIVVIILAIALWMTDSLHGIHPGWIALGAALVLSIPALEVLTVKSFAAVNVGTLFFLCAALAIGTVGRVTGMNQWIVNLLMPGSIPSNPFLFAIIACLICMVIHMVLGSTLAVLGIACPAIITFGEMAGIPGIVSALVAYTAVAGHWMLPFHHMNLLVGAGSEGAGYTEKDTLQLGIPQTFVVIFICLLEIAWWKIIGLLP